MGKKPTPPPPQNKKRGRKPKRRCREETRSSGSTVSSSVSALRSGRKWRNEDDGLQQPVTINEATMPEIQSEIDSFSQVIDQNSNRNLHVTESVPSPNYSSTQNFETSGPSLSQRDFGNAVDAFLYQILNDPDFQEFGNCSDSTPLPDLFTETAEFDWRYQTGSPTTNSNHSATGMRRTEIQNYTTNVPTSDPFNSTVSSSFQIPDSNETPNMNGVQPGLLSIKQLLMNEPEGDYLDELDQYIGDFEYSSNSIHLMEFTSSNNPIQSSTSHNHEMGIDNGEIDLGQTENQPNLQTQNSPTNKYFNLPASLPNQTLSASVPNEVPGRFENMEPLADVVCNSDHINPPHRDSVVQDETQDFTNFEVPELGSATANSTTDVPIAGPTNAAAAASDASSTKRITLSQIAGAFLDVASVFRHVQNTENLVKTAGYPLHGLVKNVIRSYKRSVGKGWPEMPMPMPMSGATCRILLDEPSPDPQESPEVIDLVSSDEEEDEDKENLRK